MFFLHYKYQIFQAHIAQYFHFTNYQPSLYFCLANQGFAYNLYYIAKQQMSKPTGGLRLSGKLKGNLIKRK